MPDDGGLLRPLDLLASGANLVGDGLHAATVLGRARLIRPLRPDRPPRALAAIQRWGFTPAGGFAAAAALYPDAEAVVDERGALTFAELEDRSNRLANALADAGVLEGDGVGVMVRNHRGFVEVLVALSKLGADAMLLNTSFAGPQLTEVVKREKPRAIVYDAEFSKLLKDALYRRKGFVAWRDEDDDVSDPTLEELIEEGDPATPLPPDREGRQTILTSGTTGTPKGASRGSPGIGAAVAILASIPLRGREKVLIAPPLFHQWGFAHFGLAMLTASTMVLRRKFDPENVLETIERERIDTVPMVPVMLQRILDLDDEARRGHDTGSLRVVPVSGSALSGELAGRFMDEFGDVVYNLYGSTEVAWVAIAGPKDLRDAPGTAGRAPRGTELEILGDDDRPVPTGGTGRIFVRNSMLFEGYTGGGSKDMVRGMMATGDVGRLDEEGRLFVEGRDDDMIVSGGENVFPQEVEETLAKHPNVADAAVLGVDDEKWGQALKAFVVKKGSVSESALKQHVKDNLAGYKVPQAIEFIDELPRNPAGKVLKRELAGDDA
ncbi:MAG TPA: AMP-binding protein [Solirubrobacteraceae bacterium]|nr:AMP-binding protein [Solirubrobacteraceae bacterium]